jgi:hypothetical protein
MSNNNHHDLMEARNKIADTVEHARLAYEFVPGSYTWTVYETSLAALRRLDTYIAKLAKAARTKGHAA